MNLEDKKFVRRNAVYIGEVSTAIHEACHCACAILNQNQIVTVAIGIGIDPNAPNAPSRCSDSEVAAWVHTKMTGDCTTDDLILQTMAPIVAAEIWGIRRGGLVGDMEDVEKYLRQLPEHEREAVRQENREVLRRFLPACQVGIFRIAHELLRHRSLDGETVKRLLNTNSFKPPLKFRRALRVLPEMNWRFDLSPDQLAWWFSSSEQPPGQPTIVNPAPIEAHSEMLAQPSLQ